MKTKSRKCTSKLFFTFTSGFMLCFFMAASSWAAKKIDLSPSNINDCIRPLNEKGITGKALGLTNDEEIKWVRSREDFNGITQGNCQNYKRPVAQVIAGVKKKNLENDANIQGRPISSMSGLCCNSSCCQCSSKKASWAIEDDDCMPPHANGTKGEGDYYVQTVNTSIGIFNTTSNSGDLKKSNTSYTFNDFFSLYGESFPCNNSNIGNPFVLYDRYNHRWFIMDTARNQADGISFFSIAASKTSNPNGNWSTYCLQADTEHPGYFIDTPRCGLWHDGIYITANMLSKDNDPNTYQYTRVWVLKTPDIYNGNLITQSIPIGNPNDTRAKFLLPSNAGSPGAPPGPNIMYSMDPKEAMNTKNSCKFANKYAIYVWILDVNWNPSAQISFKGPSEISTAPFLLPAEGVPQPGTETELDSHYGRLMYPANYWNFGDHESVVLCHVCDVCDETDCEKTRRRAIRWYELKRDSNNTFHFNQQGTVSIPSAHCWMGSIAINENGDIAMGFNVSSSTVPPSIGYCSLLVSDTLAEKTSWGILQGGSGYQTSTDWGNCSANFVDPADNQTFWYTNRYNTGNACCSCENDTLNTFISAFPVDIADAVDYTVTFTESGSANWAKVTDVYYYDGDSAKSGTITHSQSCSIETIVAVTETSDVKFYWQVSSEANYDYLRFYIDGTQKNQISGSTTWAQVINSISAGTHTLTWTYYKDASVSSGSDCGWVDKLEITAGGGCGYCDCRSTNCTEEWIARVRIGTLDKSSSASNYSDFTSIVTNYTRGVSQSVTLTPGFSGSAYTEYWRIFIDYNKGGDFLDSGETVFSKSGSSEVTGSFTPPTSASTGNTRMRVTMKYGGYASPCGTFTYGEVEDYTANIL